MIVMGKADICTDSHAGSWAEMVQRAYGRSSQISSIFSNRKQSRRLRGRMEKGISLGDKESAWTRGKWKDCWSALKIHFR